MTHLRAQVALGENAVVSSWHLMSATLRDEYSVDGNCDVEDQGEMMASSCYLRLRGKRLLHSDNTPYDGWTRIRAYIGVSDLRNNVTIQPPIEPLE